MAEKMVENLWHVLAMVPPPGIAWYNQKKTSNSQLLLGEGKRKEDLHPTFQHFQGAAEGTSLG